MSKYVGFRLGEVHESHVISEYYCGGCGWPVTDHDSFCPECGGAFRECDASNLEAENAELRNELVKLRKIYKWYMARIWEQEQTIEYQRKENVDWEEQYRSLATENDKLRDAMYTNAERHALQHMDEDELRIWATQQSEYIEELKELCKDMWQDIPKTESCGWDISANCCIGYDKCKGECSYWYRMHKLGIEVVDG